MTGPDLFAAACGALYGDRWQTQAKGLLGVCKTTISNWRSGRTRVPVWAWRVLHQEIQEREKRLAELGARARWASTGSPQAISTEQSAVRFGAGRG